MMMGKCSTKVNTPMILTLSTDDMNMVDLEGFGRVSLFWRWSRAASVTEQSGDEMSVSFSTRV